MQGYPVLSIVLDGCLEELLDPLKVDICAVAEEFQLMPKQLAVDANLCREAKQNYLQGVPKG